MYGQPGIDRPAYLKEADEEFIKTAVDDTGSRKKASKAWSFKGEKLFFQHQLDLAMQKYNQSWLLNPDNYQPYWGFARIMLQKNKIDEGIKYLEMAEQLIDNDYQKVALLSDLGTAYSYKGGQNPDYFSKANSKFSESIKLDPSYPNSWGRWAVSLYRQGKYKDAWAKVKKAQSLNARPFSPDFLAALKKKLPGNTK
jgi:tetratricopeptide (TPR) repeat protein